MLAALVAGIFGGVVSNIVKARLDESGANRRLRFERQLNRQERILEAQAKLLDDLTDAIWKWRYTTVQLAYAGGNSEACSFDTALTSYRSERWKDLNMLRTLASRARRLISNEMHGIIVNFYATAVEFDCRIENIADQSDPIRRVMEFGEINHELVNSVTDAIDELLLRLGSELDLVSRTSQKGLQ